MSRWVQFLVEQKVEREKVWYSMEVSWYCDTGTPYGVGVSAGVVVMRALDSL